MSLAMFHSLFIVLKSYNSRYIISEFTNFLISSCDLRDVEALDALFHQSLAWIMESDITDVSLDLSFTVNEELGGQVRTIISQLFSHASLLKR
jgi:hypothetical protein